MEYYAAIKWNEVLIYTIPWLNLEHVMLNESSQIYDSIYFHFILELGSGFVDQAGVQWHNHSSLLPQIPGLE